MRGWRTIIIATTLFLAVVACKGSDASKRAADPALARESPRSTYLGGSAWSAVEGFGGVWIQVDPPADQLVKVDSQSGEIVLAIDGGTSAAAGEDGMWITVRGEQTRKIDPVTGDVLVTAPTPQANYVTVGAGSVWVPAPRGVTRLDPETGERIATVRVDGQVTDLLATNNAVWVTDKEAGTVIRIDASSNDVVASVATGAGAHDLAVDRSGIWVTSYQDNTVSHIDPATNTVVATVEGVGSGVGITAADGAIWTSRQEDGIYRIDPNTHQAQRVAALNEWNYGIVVIDGELWVTSVASGVIHRLPAD
jgi:YVTN family beta-propeller protein